ncbi:hypothetical protein JCM33374_g6471 [Metschnikowia sp. JCM 33374]|nr:hypothetical protein JCM33374_g6471 [Metschnikowia sp. JCM 33374]
MVTSLRSATTGLSWPPPRDKRLGSGTSASARWCSGGRAILSEPRLAGGLVGNTDRICPRVSSTFRPPGGYSGRARHCQGSIDGFMVIDSSGVMLIPVFDDASSILSWSEKETVTFATDENDVLHELSQ